MNTKVLITVQNPKERETATGTGCQVLTEYPDALLARCDEAQLAALKTAKLEVAQLPEATVQIAGMAFSMATARDANESQPLALDPNRRAYYLLELVGPAKAEWLKTLEALGGVMQGNFAGFTLLLGILPSKVAELQTQPWVESVTPYRPAMKVSPQLRPGASRSPDAAELAALDRTPAVSSAPAEEVEIAVFSGEGTANVAAQIRQGGGTVLSESPQKLVALVAPDAIPALADDPAVQAILPHRFPKFHNDRAAEVMAAPANHVVADLTLTGTGQMVAVADSGLDTGDAATVHLDIRGRVHSINSFPLAPSIRPYTHNVAPFDDGAVDAHSGHGTHVAGSILGNGHEATAHGAAFVPQGLAPEAQIYSQAVEQFADWKTAAQLVAEGLEVPDHWGDPDYWPPFSLWGLPEDLTDLFTPAYAAGARIHTNSWGGGPLGAYTGNAREVDKFMWNHRDMLIHFSAGNEGEDADGNGVIDQDSIGSPGTAKNCLTVGACENNRPYGSTPTPAYDFDWTDWMVGPATPAWPHLGAAGQISDNPNGMAAFSSRGPADDGRLKPDVVAPGTNVLSVRSSAFVPTPAKPEPLWGDLAAGHALHGLYCWSGGTSMSTPLVAGAAALIRQHLVHQRGHFQAGVKPSGALIKAFIVNGAQSMSPGQFVANPLGHPPIPATDEIPAGRNNVNGFGRVNLVQSLTPGALARTLFADEPAYAVASGEMRTFEVKPVEAAQPLKATLVWTDAPAPVNVGGIQNHLYLQVVRADGTIVDGDVNAYPTATNNVQQVIIDAPAQGTYQIRVRGVSVTQHAPSATPGPAPRQDFALVVSNAMGFSMQPVSIAQAIDTTGSMDFYGYIEPAKERAAQLVDFMRINDKVSITEFSDRGAGMALARTPYPLRLMGQWSPDWSDAHAAIAGLHADGLTPIGAGLQEAWNQLHTEPVSRPRAIVLLSDGFNNRMPDPATVLPAIPADVPIFTIALGPACNTPALQYIANSRLNGGYFVVESDQDIGMLHAIYAQVQALAAGSALAGLLSAEVQSGKEAEHVMDVEAGATEVTFTLSWDPVPGTEGLRLTVIGPDGAEANDKALATVIREGGTYRMARVAMPKAGTWRLRVRHLGGNPSLSYTLSGALQAPLTLNMEPAKLAQDKMLLTARLRRGQKLWDDAKILARLTLPTRSYAQVLQESGDKIKDIKLPDAVAEQGFNDDQLLLLKLDAFAAGFKEQPGGLYDRKTIEIELQPQGNGTWIGEAPTIPGNVSVEVVGEGAIDGVRWQRTARQAVHVPQAAVAPPKLTIEDIFVRRNSLWQYAVVGVRLRKADGAVATPRDGVAVEVTAIQGRTHLASGPLPFYKGGGYFIWRVMPVGFRPGVVTLTAEAKFDGVVVATASKQVGQF